VSRNRVFLARLLPVLRSGWPWIVLAVLAVVGFEELKDVDLSVVRNLLRDTDPAVLALLVGLTAANLFVFGLYDVVALGPAADGPPRMSRWTVGVVSFAWSNFLTVGPLAGPALRLWLYRPLGIPLDRGRRALGAILFAFASSLGVICAAVTVPLPAVVEGPGSRLALAGAGLAILGGVWSRVAGAHRGLLVIVAAVDWLLAWSVFHAAVSGFRGDVPPGLSLQVFFQGQAVGLASLVPGGFGSADLFWGTRLAAVLGGHDRVVAALVLYRTVYYVLPFLAASAVLIGQLVRTGRRTAWFLRTVAATYALVSGAVLLASAASPSLRARMDVLERTVPLTLVELSHAASVALGFLLLLVSRGLARGYRSSHRVAVALFLGGAVATFAKGLDFEEALVVLAAAAALVVFRRAFERPGRVHPSLEFLVSSIVFAVLLFGAVGLGSYASLPDVPLALSRFSFLAHEERFVRGLLLLAAVAAGAVVWWAQRSRVPESLPDPAGIDRALADVRALGRGTDPLLVATGDKAIFRPEEDAPAFVPYRTSGRFRIAFGDPVCAPGAETEILEAFLRMCSDWDREPVLYQVSPALLPAVHDLGMGLFKLGESGVVDLERFDLRGNKAKSWRHAINAAEKAGASFAIVDAPSVPGLLEELRRVSDAWLRDKATSEKGFSLGRFDPAYLSRFPCAVVRNASARVVAFANVLENARDGEISVDLMRQIGPQEEGAVPEVMEVLFLKLMLSAKERGFKRFQLGMAPLSAVGESTWARPTERTARLFFLHGESWYNYRGLRRFKEKFDPVWEPRYLAYSKPWQLPLVLAAVARLVSGGWRGLMPAREKAA
jgi:phosphatidylglycerol lysyltransferase